MTSLNVLVVEDDAQNQAILKMVIARAGHMVESAWDGHAAVAAASGQHFDLILMDLHLPGMNGLEACRAIRAAENGRAKRVPIVALTGAAETPEFVEECRRSGMDTFLTKPFDLRRLDALLRLVHEAADEPAHERGAATQAQLPVLDVDNALPRFVEGTVQYGEMLRSFIRSLPGRQADIFEAHDAGQLDVLAGLAHNLKGVAANFGARQVSLLAARLEQACDERDAPRTAGVIDELADGIAVLQSAAENVIHNFDR